MESADDYFCRIIDQMTNKERPHNAYFDNLLKLFKEMDPSFNDNEIDWGFTDDVFALLVLKDIPIQDLRDFVENTKGKIELAIKSDQTHIIRQPAFILLAYYLLKNPNWIDKQEISEAALKVAKTALGISSGKY